MRAPARRPAPEAAALAGPLAAPGRNSIAPAVRALAAAVAVAVTAGIAVAPAAASPAGGAAAAAASTPASPPAGFFGVVTQSKLDEDDFDRMAAAGVGTLRFQLSWRHVQRVDGPCAPDLRLGICDWGPYDRIIGSAAASGIESLPFFLNVPSFVSPHENSSPVRSDSARRRWEAFLYAAVDRYGPGGHYWRSDYGRDFAGASPLPVRRWQVWNEPSDGTFWHPRPDPAEYGELVEVTAAAIRSRDPAAEIVLAGLFGSPNRSHGGIRARPFLRRLLADPALGSSFDAYALHPYGPSVRRVKRQVRGARKEIRRSEITGKPLWITEIGWGSGEGGHPKLSKTPAMQAKLLRRAYRLFLRRSERWGVAGVTWFAWQDSDAAGACPFCTDVGLVTVERRLKPAYYAFSRLAG